VLEGRVRGVLASPRRLAILRAVWREERPAGAIHRAMPDVTFGAVSQHLRALERAGLVRRRVDGRQRCYLADRPALGSVAVLLEQMWDDALWRLRQAAELEEARRGPRARTPRARTPRATRATAHATRPRPRPTRKRHP
jgi:DNA-binding transcriptional ArsR family regulator